MSSRMIRRSLLVASLVLATAVPAAVAQDREILDVPGRQRPMKPADLRPQEIRFWESADYRRELLATYIPATGIEPDVTEDDREAVQDILALVNDEAFDEAIEEIQKRRNDAASAVFDFLLGNVHFQNDRLPEAIEAYNVAIEKYPNYRRAWNNIGQIRVRQQDFASALPALTKVIELGGTSGKAFGLLGYCYTQVKDPVAAESAYRMAVLLDPGNRDWKEGLAYSLFQQERYADSSAMLARLIEQDPGNDRLWILQANAFIGLEQVARAAQNYEMVDRLGASTVDTLNQLADIYVNEGLYTAAVDTYDRAMELDLDARPQRALLAARLMVARGQYDETRRLVQSIDDLYGYTLDEGERKDLLRVQARIAVAEGAGDEQVRILEEIIRVDPLDGDALILLGQHHYRSDEPERAIFLFERAANIEAFEADAKVWHAQVLVSRKDYSAAIPLLKSAQGLKPRESVRAFLESVERFAARG